MAKDFLTQQQLNFTLDVFADVVPTQAYLTHYKCKPSAARSLASRLLTNANVQAKLTELRAKAESDKISTVTERRQRLTAIQRATVADFVDEFGNLSITSKEQLRTPAVAEIKTERTLMGMRTTLKLRDPVGAITEHNKMDKIYTDGSNINIGEIKVLVIREPEKLIDATK